MDSHKHKIDTRAIFETKRIGKGTTGYADYMSIYRGKEKHIRPTEETGLLMRNTYKQK